MQIDCVLQKFSHCLNQVEVVLRWSSIEVDEEKLVSVEGSQEGKRGNNIEHGHA